MKYVLNKKRKLDLVCKTLFIAVTAPGRSFQIFVPLTLKLDEAFAYSTWILLTAADLYSLDELELNVRISQTNNKGLDHLNT